MSLEYIGQQVSPAEKPVLPAAVKQVLAVMDRAGYEAYSVGGCVRDALLGKTPSDWDITTVAEPAAVMEAFKDYRVIETGLKHGTVTVLIDGMPMEITTYRVDGEYTDHRRPDGVTFTRSLTEDLARRDFTVNAMAYRPDRGIIDPFGGKEDLQNRVLRCVGEADKRIKEDPLRILRGMRFMASYGLRAEQETDASMRRNTELLSYISAERIRVELEKLLLAADARRILLAYSDIMTFVIPELKPIRGYCQHNRWHDLDLYAHTVKAVENVPKVGALKWAALMHDLGKPASQTADERGEYHFYGHADISTDMAYRVMTRLKFDNVTRDTVMKLIKHHSDLPEPAEKYVYRAVIRSAETDYGMLLDLQQADSLALSADEISPRTEPMPLLPETVAAREQSLRRVKQVRDIYGELLNKPHCFSVNELKISGNVLSDMGFSGREIGHAKELLLRAVADGKVINSEEQLKQYLKSNGIKPARRNT